MKNRAAALDATIMATSEYAAAVHENRADWNAPFARASFSFGNRCREKFVHTTV